MKRTNNDLQSITYKTKDRVARSTLKTGRELRCSGRALQVIHLVKYIFMDLCFKSEIEDCLKQTEMNILMLKKTNEYYTESKLVLIIVLAYHM